MSDRKIVFDVEQIGRLFPFYILVNRNFEVQSSGNTISKMFGIVAGDNLVERFVLHTPAISLHRFAELGGKSYQLLAAVDKPDEYPMMLQGELEYLSSTDELLFLGAPSIKTSRINGNKVNSKPQLDDHDSVNVTASEQGMDSKALLPDNIRGVAITDRKGAIEWVSRDFEQSIGFSLQEVKGLRPRDVIYGKESTYIPSSYVDDMVRKKKTFSFDNIGYNRNKESFWFRTTVQPILDKKGEVSGRYYYFEDITELKTNEHALHESQQLWKFALEGAGDGVWSYEVQNSVFKVSNKFKELLGYSANDPYGTTELEQAMEKDDFSYLMQHILPNLSQHNPSFSLEHRICNKEGIFKHYKTRGKILKWAANGQPETLYGTLTDINEEKLKDLEVKRLATRFGTILENLNYAILVENENRKIVLANQKFCDLFSVPIPVQEMVGMDCSNMLGLSKGLFTDPDAFVARIDELLQNQRMDTNNIMPMVDGRILELDYIPIIIDNLYAGHLWKYNDVTKPKKLEIQLKNSEARLSALINNFNAAVLLEDTNRTIIFANRALYQIINAPASAPSLVGANSLESLQYIKHLFKKPEEELNRINEIVANRSHVSSKLVEMLDGKILKQQFIPVVVDSEESGFLWIYEDITESVNHEKQITEQREYFHRILNELPADVMMFDLNQNFDFINRNAVRNDEMRNWLIGKNMYDYCAKKGIDNTRAVQRDIVFREVLATRQPKSMVDKHTLPDGSDKYMLRFLYPFLDKEGNTEYVVGFGMDITEQIQNEIQVAEQREYYHEILNEVPADIVIFSLDHRYQFINKNAVRNEETREWLIGKTDFDYCAYKGIDDGMAHRRKKMFDDALRYKKPVNIIDDVCRADNTTAHILRVMYPCVAANGVVKFVIGYGIDITEQIENKLKAETEEKRILNLLHLVKDGIFTCTENGDVRFYNNSFARMLGLSEMTTERSVSFIEMLPTGEKTKFFQCIKDLQVSGLPQSCVLNIPTNSGKVLYVDFSITESVAKTDGLYVGRISDISEIVNRELYLNEIIAKEKELNNSKSQFIRITSHELRTPLAIIQTNTEILEMFHTGKIATTSRLKPDVMVGRILKEVQHMTEILNELMMLSRIEEGKMDYKPEELDLLPLLQGIRDDMYNPHTDGRTLSLNFFSEQNAYAYVDKKLIRYAIVNLINNAFKYSAEKSPPELRLKKTKSSLIIEVEDYGIGIPESEQQKLFSSFFRATNTGVIQGSGLGLMVVDYVVKKHNGIISFSSTQHQGSIFSISIPID